MKVKKITKSFNGIKRLDNISFNIKKGDFTVIAGANGSGKTLLVKHLNGLIPVKKNSILLDNKDCYKRESYLKKDVGVIFQNPDSQIVGLSVKEDIIFGLINIGIKKADANKRVEDVMKRLHITHLKDRNPYTLSGGEKKRVNIAGILVMEPKIIIFDEPFTGLDYPGVIDVTKTILHLKETGETVIVITHDLEKILAYTDKMIILNNGKLVAEDTPENLIDEIEKWSIRRPSQKNIKEMSWLI